VLGYFLIKIKYACEGIYLVYTMTEVSEIYYCEVCGNKVKVLENGVGELVCCGLPMVKVEE